MTSGFPFAFQEIPTWAADHGVTVSEARTRFAQYAILRAIAGSRALVALLVFKGGNALDFVWQPNRSTRDLDFSVDMPRLTSPLSPARLHELFVPALAVSTRELGVAIQVPCVRQQPPGPEKTFVTYEARVGYALPDEQPLWRRLEQGLPSTRVIPVEISLNEPIGDARSVASTLPTTCG